MDIFIISSDEYNGSCKSYLNALKEIYHSNGDDYRVIVCRSRSEIIEKTLYYSTTDFTRFIFSIGGSDTLNGVINGFYSPNKPLVIIPVGGNLDWYRDISLLSCDTRVDLGSVNGEYFLSRLSIGLDELISFKFNGSSNMKKCSYIRELLRTSPNFFGVDGSLSSDEYSIRQNIVLASFYNGSYFGNSCITSSSLVDGKLDLVLAYDSGRLNLLCDLLKIWLSRDDVKNIINGKLSEACMVFDYPVAYMFDGIRRIDSELNVSVSKEKILIKRDIDPRIKSLYERNS